jgi:hypothetical protein
MGRNSVLNKNRRFGNPAAYTAGRFANGAAKRPRVRQFQSLAAQSKMQNDKTTTMMTAKPNFCLVSILRAPLRSIPP